MRPVAVIVLAASILAAASTALAQPQAKRNKGGIAMNSVLSLNQDGTGVKVIGGRPAKTQDWPASFYSSSDLGRCTATLVGPRALLLAAHCVGIDQLATIKVLGKSYSGPCKHAPNYQEEENGPGDPSQDYALCRMSEEVTGIKFETINRNPTRLKRGQRLRLTGYGCTEKPASSGGEPSGGNDGIYRLGEAKIIALPGDTKVEALPGESANEPNTILTQDQTMVCPGDSGGGCYIMLSDSLATRRLLACVNSRVWFEKGLSYLSSTSSADGLAFINNWIRDNDNEKICGVNLSGNRCR